MEGCENVNQSQEMLPDFNGCESYDEIIQHLRLIGDRVEGSQIAYTTEDIVEQISGIQNMRISGDEEKAQELLKYVTSTAGLRKAVDRVTKNRNIP